MKGSANWTPEEKQMFLAKSKVAKEILKAEKLQLTLNWGRSDAIRAKCLECSNEMMAEVAHCIIKQCALYPFRSGGSDTVENNVKWEEAFKASDFGKWYIETHPATMKEKN